MLQEYMNKTPFAELAEYMDLLLDAICAVDQAHRRCR